jgi:hypothetical protein
MSPKDECTNMFRLKHKLLQVTGIYSICKSIFLHDRTRIYMSNVPTRQEHSEWSGIGWGMVGEYSVVKSIEHSLKLRK